jgi:formylglycine-generating enzyme required for sulfatase activity
MNTKIKEREMKKRGKVQGGKYREQGYSFVQLLIVMGFVLSAVSLSAQGISNVQASFDKKKAEITVSCHLESSTPKDLTLFYSIDRGYTWKPCVSVSGDIKNQTTGIKNIIWAMSSDGVFMGEFLFKINDNVNWENITIEMVFVAGGTFTMGCTVEQEDDCYEWEEPAHRVTLNDFYIGKYEVTQALWKEVMGTTISQQRDKVDKTWVLHGEGENYPMYYVSWDEIQEFIYKLNEKTGKDYRLPTEAEWEYASRGGNESRRYKYSGSNSVEEVAWYSDNSGGTTHVVGQKKGNELELYDMSGNVGEWCNDWYGAYSNSLQENPVGASSSSGRVNRGGGWIDRARSVRVSERSNYPPDFCIAILGFRLACNSNE